MIPSSSYLSIQIMKENKVIVCERTKDVAPRTNIAPTTQTPQPPQPRFPATHSPGEISPFHSIQPSSETKRNPTPQRRKRESQAGRNSLPPKEYTTPQPRYARTS